jgi:radical SAM superfamily enzyme YgiQ (UPF0313 family)
MEIRRRLAAETGTLRGAGRRDVALVYAGAYDVGMASLGFQSVYRSLNSLPDTVAERSFLPDGDGRLVTYESRRPVSDFGLVAFSIAWELELADLVTCLERAGLPPRARDRSAHPLVVVGGPLTAVNAKPLAAVADAIVIGDSELVLEPLLDTAFSAGERGEILARLAAIPGVFVPVHHGERVPSSVPCPKSALPARAAIWTAQSALPDMFLVEAVRGCARACSFCVMRACGMRVVHRERVLDAIPGSAPRVGLVGASVSDHPELDAMLESLVASGRGVGISSLRADRLTGDRVALLARAGYRTLTVAADGASERLRESLEKRVREEHLVRAVELARAHDLEQVKVYAMVGVPGETDTDLEELTALMKRLAGGSGRLRVTLAVSPFVPKPGTPLAGAAFAGIRVLERRLQRLRRLQPRVRVRSGSARWAWVEWVLAHGGAEAGHAVVDARRAGGGFAAMRRALSPLEPAGERGNVPA